jgi:hypothetical protein
MLTGIGRTLVDVRLARRALVTRPVAVARVRIDTIRTRSAVLTRIGRAVVYVGLAVGAGIAVRTRTGVCICTVRTRATIHARLVSAVIDVDITCWAAKAPFAVARVARNAIDIGATIQARAETAIINIGLALATRVALGASAGVARGSVHTFRTVLTRHARTEVGRPCRRATGTRAIRRTCTTIGLRTACCAGSCRGAPTAERFLVRGCWPHPAQCRPATNLFRATVASSSGQRLRESSRLGATLACNPSARATEYTRRAFRASAANGATGARVGLPISSRGRSASNSEPQHAGHPRHCNARLFINAHGATRRTQQRARQFGAIRPIARYLAESRQTKRFAP